VKPAVLSFFGNRSQSGAASPASSGATASSPSLRGRSVAWWLGQLGLYLLLWLSLVKLPDAPGLGLDTSWRMVISQAADQGLQFGRDIAFTYGPMGYLLSYTYAGKLFAANWTWQIVGNLLIAAGLWRFGTMLSARRMALYYTFLFCFGSMFSDAMLMNFIIVFALMLLRPEFQRWYWLGGIGAFFAIFSLMKFTSLFLCGFIVVAATSYFLWHRCRREAAILAGSFAGCFLFGWLAYGQSLLFLPAFFKHGLEVSLGYPGAMAEDAAPLIFIFGLIAAAGAVTYFILYFVTETDRTKAAYVVLVLSAICLLNWKHGFTRADGHVLAHFIPLLMIACAYPVLTQDNRRYGLAKSTALIVTAGASIGGMATFMPITVTLAPHSWNYRVRDAAFALGHLDENRAELEMAWKTTAQKVALKYIPAYVERERVTHLGDDQAYTLLNGLNFVPMPTIQSYSAYMPGLNRLDREFLTSPRGPRYVIQRYRGLQPRLPPLEDSLSQKLLYQSYYYVMEESGLILWERPARLPGGALTSADSESVLAEKIVAFDEPIAVPDSGGRPVWAEVDIRPSLLGRLRQFLYKPPFLEFSAEYSDGTSERFRFVQAMGQAGFILSPLLRDEKDLIAYQTKAWDHPVKNFRLQLRPGDERYWNPKISVRLRAIAPFQRASNGLSVTTPERFKMTNRPPTLVEAHVPPAEIFEEGKHLLHMHAPSRMEFTVPEDFHTISARFGLMPAAYAAPNATDGVDFTITWLAPDGETEELYHRFLNPVPTPADRGMQNLSIAPPRVKGGKLIFRTQPGPNGNTAFDWAYWTDIEIR
jgi:hypothetical protein